MALTKINTNLIANNTIAVTNIADNAVDATKIASNSILTRHIDDDQVTGDQLADNLTIAGTLGVTSTVTISDYVIHDGNTGTKFGFGSANTMNFISNGSDRLTIANSYAVFNEAGTDWDFRVESDDNTHMLFVDGGNDRVGIGTASPATDLHVDGANDDTYGQLRVSSPSNGDAQITFGTTANGRGMYVDDSDTNKFKIYTGHGKGTSGKEFTIDNDGNVGIAYTTPSSMNASANNLVVGSGASGDNTGLTIYSNSDASGSIHFADGTSGGDAYRGFIYYTQSSNHMAFGTDATEKMRIDSSGRLIIGHTASISGVQNMKLQVYSDTYDGSVSLGRWTDNNLGQYVNFIKSRHGTVGSHAIVQDDDVLGSIVWNADDGASFSGRSAEIRAEVDGTPGTNDVPGRLTFHTTADGSAGVSERLRIDSAGDQKLTGGTDLYVDLFADSGSSQGSASFRFRSDGTSTDQQLASIVMQQESGGGSAQKGEMLFQVSDNANPTTAVKIFNNKYVQMSAGITFGGDTAAANLLDDYEEGTFTPTYTVAGGGSAGTVTGTNTGFYTKVGRMVTVAVQSHYVPTSGTIPTSYSMTLPFAVGLIGGQAGNGSGQEVAQTGKSMFISVGNNASTAVIKAKDGAAPPANAYFNFGFTYQIA